VETKPVVKDSLSALLTNGGDSAATKGNNPLLDKIIAQGGGPVLGLFSPKDTATVNGYFKRQELEISVSRTALCMKFLWEN
jgi:SecD/SecF fusion protein